MLTLKHLFAWRIRLLGCAVLLVIVGGCQSVSSATTHSTSAAVSTPTATLSLPTPFPTYTSTPVLPASFPAFHDWRAVYLAPDRHFHAVTPDGKTDVVGPAFPGFDTQPGLALFSAGASPDGRYIAFMNVATLDIFDVRAQTPPDKVLHSSYKYLPGSMFWSPDSHYVALGRNGFVGNSTSVVPIDPLTIPQTPPVPGTSTPDTSPAIELVGWRDNHTLLMYVQIVQSTTPYTTTGIFEAVDSITGATQTLLTFPHTEGAFRNFVVSPDGQEAFMYDAQNLRYSGPDPFIPEAELINTTTGSVHPLPTLIRDGITPSSSAWRPGTHTLAFSFGGDYLLDTDTDTLTPINSQISVAGWSPDGSTLVLSNMQNDENGTDIGPSTLTAVTFTTSGQAKLTTLTHNSMSFIFLGFIRSA